MRHAKMVVREGLDLIDSGFGGEAGKIYHDIVRFTRISASGSVAPRRKRRKKITRTKEAAKRRWNKWQEKNKQRA